MALKDETNEGEVKPVARTGSALNIVIIILLFYISLAIMAGLVFLIIALQSK